MSSDRCRAVTECRTAGRESSKVPNAITELCSELEKTINQNVQRALTTLEQDCTTLTASVAQLSIGLSTCHIAKIHS